MIIKKKKKLILIDGTSILHRAWHALPPLTTPTGEVINACYGFTSMLLKIINEFSPDAVAVAFDRKEPTWRHQEYKAYKAQRIKQPNELYQQIKWIKLILELFQIPFYEKIGYEADDIIGTICQQENIQKNITIITGDLDLLQLVNKNISVSILKKGISEMVIYHQSDVKKRFNLRPEQLIDYKALAGDSSDNIPGVRGIGKKGAGDLISRFDNLDNLYQQINQSTNKIKERSKKLLLEQETEARLSKKLVTIVKDAPIDFQLAVFDWQNVNQNKLISLFQQLGFSSLIKRLPTTIFSEHPSDHSLELTNKYYVIKAADDLNEFLIWLAQVKHLIVDLDTEKDILFGISIYCPDKRISSISSNNGKWQLGKIYYLSWSIIDLQGRSLIKDILENNLIKKQGYNLKSAYKVLSKQGIKLAGIDFDVMIAGYLLNPDKKTSSLDDLILEKLKIQRNNPIQSSKIFKQLAGNERTKQQINSIYNIYYLDQLVKKITLQLKEKKLGSVFQTIETPIISLLARMEQRGVKINLIKIKRLLKEAKQKISKIKDKIYCLTGQEFNINSPQQLQEILFRRLELPTNQIKKTKKGWSTAATELNKLKNYPIIQLIFQYRELNKIITTYLKPLPSLVNPITKRLYTNLNQTGTATGRLSSLRPNLQNIPIQGKWGKSVRQCFITERGWKFLSVDYSQIDLRIIAHLSGDQAMLDSFAQQEDIHSRTASEIYNVKINQVIPEMRHIAKRINFGLLYGITAYGLSQATELDRQQAQEYIDRFFDLHPRLVLYQKKLLQQARQQQFVETLFGRKRFLPAINSRLPLLKASIERIAINLPIQGTTADLIKLAMFKIDSRISRQDAIMILQIHDELLFEVKETKILMIAKIIQQIMEKPPIKLNVALRVNFKTGNNWGEMKKFKI